MQTGYRRKRRTSSASCRLTRPRRSITGERALYSDGRTLCIADTPCFRSFPARFCESCRRRDIQTNIRTTQYGATEARIVYYCVAFLGSSGRGTSRTRTR